MGTVRTSGSAILALAFAAPALAAAPAELLNKSVTISYTVTIPAVGEDGVPSPGIRHATRVLYISTAGRVFARVIRQDGRLSATKEAAPGANTMRFEGGRLVGVMPFVSGAAQMVVAFGAGGQSCTASILMGREGGRTLTWKGVNGKTYRATGPAVVSDVSCAVMPGNAFAGQ